MINKGKSREYSMDYFCADGYEKCVICHKQLAVSVDTPIDQRQTYVSGVGQLCDLCYCRDFLGSAQNYMGIYSC